MATWLYKLPQAGIKCNAKKVRETLQNVQLDVEKQLMSLDVENLFKNVSAHELRSTTVVRRRRPGR